MRQDTREVNLARRIYCLELHIKFLEKLEADPSIHDREIRRRTNCIEELLENIRLHTEAIARLKSQREDAPAAIAEAKTKLRSLVRLRNANLIEQLMAEYINVHKTLEKTEC